jgi:hypothetical protein
MRFEGVRGEKKRGQEALLEEISRRVSELNEKRKRKWITQSEYDKERAQIEEYRLEVLTDPDLG